MSLDKDENKTDNPKGGILGKLFLPSYTDAGAGTSFRPAATLADVDYMSETATEIHDNRTSTRQERMMMKKGDDKKDSSPLRRSPLSNNSPGGSNNIKGFFPSTKPPKSPHPVSPPNVTRQQMLTRATSAAGTSVVPEIGEATDLEMPMPEEDKKESDLAQTRFQYWKDGNIDNQGNKEAPVETDSRTSDDADRDNSLLEDGNGSDVGSYVSSTASEMGTVINVNHSARLAEIDAMAAMIEANPHFDEDVIGKLTESSTATPGLSLPILETKSFDRPAFLPQSKTNIQSLNEQNFSRIKFAKKTQHQQQIQTQTTIHPQQLSTTNATTSTMMSATIRRIGSGLKNSSLSAPPTPKTPGVPPPPRVEDLLKSTLTPRGNNSIPRKKDLSHEHPPPSFALRSPGSSARMNHQSQQKSILMPRFSPAESSTMTPSRSSQLLPINRSLTLEHTLDPKKKETSNTASSHPSTASQNLPPMTSSMLVQTIPLPFVKKCFSYDGIVEEPAPPLSSEYEVFDLPTKRTTAKPWIGSSLLKHSQSWDVGGAFRDRGHNSSLFGALRQTTSQDEQRRARLHSDFSPTKTVQLRTPQRIEIEREDALDILSVIVEQGVSAWNPSSSIPAGVQADERGDDNTPSRATTDANNESDSESLIQNMADELRKISLGVDDADSKDNNHSKRMVALEELLKSHAYALEMKRAATSASTWLKSIGRCPSSMEGIAAATGTTIGHDGREQLEKDHSGGEASGEKDRSEISGGSDSAASTKIEILALKAMLHNAQLELEEKTERNRKLDEELCKCRAEIGRLKSASSRVVNQSIMDDASVSTTNTDNDRKMQNERAPSPILRVGSDIDESNKILSESFQGNSSIFQGLSEADRLDVLAMKTSLQQANETIRQLHGELHKDSPVDKCEPAPVVDLPDLSAILEESPPTGAPAVSASRDENHRTVNVRMLDGENFVTEWDELTPLPPPPDHGLRSPIVRTVLEQWTSDRSLHESLVGWVERVMTGDNLEESVPPLTISSLDHQVRDGFAMHVLPLLLRRADIHVAVKTRAHRRTTYDMAVTISQKLPEQQSIPASNLAVVDQQQSLLDRHSKGDEWIQNFQPHISRANSVANSAVTEQIVNSGNRFNAVLRNRQQGDEEYSGFDLPNAGSADFDESQQPGLMGTLGGALGGLLSRNTYLTASPSRAGLPSSPVPSTYGFSNLSTDRGETEDQPYHRVVSAPPGRIGVTFVDFRGHAVVSDVAADSPLSGWVHSADILIAIDEIPVSGMRVRDIINVLTTRRDRQRALRVISSHAMNEFTVNASNLQEEDLPTK